MSDQQSTTQLETEAGNTTQSETIPAQNDDRAPDHNNRTLLWVLGGAALFILFGCLLVSLPALWFTTRSETTAASVNVSPGVVTTVNEPVTLPPPRTVIATPEGGLDYETAVLATIYDQVNPSVVNVTVLNRGDSLLPNQHPGGIDPDDLLEISSGSGFVWDALGHIVTNNHVLADAEELQITFSDGTVAVAQLVGTDVDSDLAVLQIDPEGYSLVPITVGNMDDVMVGMRVAAIGNPFGLEGTLTSGIVSAVGRSIPARGGFSIPDSIQTDAAINPGNSGGPLLNEQGELIGVNAQIRSDVRANSGVGFAIPVSIVKRVVPAIIDNGEYIHSYMGISGGTLSPVCAEELDVPKTLRGAVVNQVLSRTPASRAGLRGGDNPINSMYPSICPDGAGGDIIVAIDGQSVTTFDDVLSYLQRYTSPGDTVTLTVWRDGETLDVDMTLGARRN
jgi:S1-C subfamily serine protease